MEWFRVRTPGSRGLITHRGFESRSLRQVKPGQPRVPRSSSAGQGRAAGRVMPEYVPWRASGPCAASLSM